MNKVKGFIALMLLGLAVQVVAQNPSADIERLTKEMYYYFSTDSSEHFMLVTDSLKDLCRKSGDEVTFYKAWSNQANHAFTKISREKGLAIAKEERAYAEKHNSKYGLYSSTGTYATMMSSIGMIDEAEKGFQQVIDYQKRFFPDDNAAYAYIGLAKIEDNRHHFAKTIDYALKTLAEKNVKPIHQLHAFIRCHQADSILCSIYERLVHCQAKTSGE